MRSAFFPGAAFPLHFPREGNILSVPGSEAFPCFGCTLRFKRFGEVLRKCRKEVQAAVRFDGVNGGNKGMDGLVTAFIRHEESNHFLRRGGVVKNLVIGFRNRETVWADPAGIFSEERPGNYVKLAFGIDGIADEFFDVRPDAGVHGAILRTDVGKVKTGAHGFRGVLHIRSRGKVPAIIHRVPVILLRGRGV